MCTKKLTKESGIGPKTFGKYMILSQNIGKVLHFSKKHSKNIAFCKENIRRVSSSEPNHSRNTKVQDKPFEKYCICQSSDQIIRFLLNIYAIHLKSFVFVPAKKGKYLFLTKTIQEISNFYKKNLKNIFILSQNIQKVSKSDPKHLRNIIEVSKFYPKYLKNICCRPKPFERYLISTQNIIIKVSYSYTKGSNKLCTKPSKVSGLDPNHLTSI